MELVEHVMPASETPPKLHGALSQKFLTFMSIGGSITAIHYAVLVAVVTLFDTNPVLASSVSYGLASFLNYYLNAKITFRHNTAHGMALVKFFVVAAVGFLLNAIVMQACIGYLPIHYLVAQMVATAAVLLWNFYGNLVWSFR